MTDREQEKPPPAGNHGNEGGSVAKDTPKDPAATYIAPVSETSAMATGGDTHASSAPAGGLPGDAASEEGGGEGHPPGSNPDSGVSIQMNPDSDPDTGSTGQSQSVPSTSGDPPSASKDKSSRGDVDKSRDGDEISESSPFLDESADAAPPAAPAVTPAAIDGGWGWMVMLGCTFMHFLVGGFSRSYGIMFLEIQERFQSSAALTAWIGGACSALRFGCGPLVAALVNRFSFRPVVVAGALMLGTGTVLCGLVPTAELLFVTYSVMTGVGGSLVYTPGIVIVSQYFSRLRPVAIGLSTAGSGLGTFLIPPLMSFLFDYYGFAGTMLIAGAMAFNNLIPAALYRPLKKPKKENGDVNKAVVKDPKAVAGGGDPSDGADGGDDGDDGGGRACRDACGKTCGYLDLRLLADPAFLCYAICMGLVTLSYIAGQMLVPAHAADVGISVDRAAWLLSVIGIADTVGRVLSGFVFNLPYVAPRRRHFYNVAILVSALTHFLWAVADSYVMFQVVCVVHGLFNGAVVGQRATVISDLMGIRRIASAFGLTVFVQGIGVLIGPALAGFLKDETGSYMASYVFTGSCAILAALIFLMEFLCCSRHRQAAARVPAGSDVTAKGKPVKT